MSLVFNPALELLPGDAASLFLFLPEFIEHLLCDKYQGHNGELEIKCSVSFLMDKSQN